MMRQLLVAHRRLRDRNSVVQAAGMLPAESRMGERLALHVEGINHEMLYAVGGRDE